MSSASLLKRSALLIFFVLLFDQVLKIWVKTNMYYGQEFNILGNWFRLHFTENEGMAFGMKFGIPSGKLFLSLFRIAALTGIGWYLLYLIRHQAKPLLIYCMSLVFAGAMGNILDSAFYGMLFSESYYMQLAQFLPEEGGYAGFLHGKVVDMLYFPLLKTTYPSWFPFWANQPLEFFRPVFNLADASISTGVIALIVFQKTLFHKNEEKPMEEPVNMETDAEKTDTL